MAKVGTEFIWRRAFAKAKQEAAYKFERGSILQIGTGETVYRPLENEVLYLEFARLDESPESCVGFANRFGLLTIPATARVPGEEPHAMWVKEIRAMRDMVTALPRMIAENRTPDIYAKLGTLDVLLVPSKRGSSPELVIEPASLVQAMRLQMAIWLAGGGVIRACEQCHTPFQAGVGGKRRSIARFCSVSCKNRHHYEQRR